MISGIKKKKYKGFSLMEMLITVFIFSLITVTAIAAFTRVFTAREKIRQAQLNLENVRSAMELMAKTMRMSSNLSGTNPATGSYQSIYLYNTSLNCISYRFNGGQLQQASASGAVAVPSDCDSSKFNNGDYSPMTDINVTGSFYVVKTDIISNPKVIGKATISVTVDNKDHLQTSVSFRDYEDIVQ
jgi:prepilin-type N-terminal cleavage/methylation domain-containing protein